MQARIGSLVLGLIAAVLCGGFHVAPAIAQEISGDKLRLGTAPTKMAPESSMFQEDATLHSVQFVDADHGWAVGDSGVILATSDGGRNWVHQRSASHASLRHLHFTSLTQGVIVGRTYQTDTGLSHGVILQTQDGGTTWTPLPHDLPGLTHVYRQSDGTLTVAGDWSTKQLGRVFQWSMATRDWQVIDTGDALRSECIAGLDTIPLWADGQGVFFRAGETPENAFALSALPGVRRIWSTSGVVVAALEDHRIMVSRDGGSTWNALDLYESPGLGEGTSASRALVDPNSVVVSQQGTIWIAGTPGDKVFRVDEDGRVTVGKTGQKAPIYGLTFLDEFRGWCVGSFGKILVTKDGGQTWRPQRNAEHRAMVMAIAKSAEHLPWSALAVEALEYGRRFVVVVEDRAFPDSGAHDPLTTEVCARTAKAAELVGGGETLGWDSREPLLERFAAAMDANEPSVLVIGSDIHGELLDRLMAIAVENQVRRVFWVVPPDARADLVFFSSAVLPVAGQITGDLWEKTLGVVAPQTPIEDRLNVRLIWDAHLNDTRIASLGEGLYVLGAQRVGEKGRRRNLQVLQARSNENAIIERLFEQSSQHDLIQAKQSLGNLLKQTPAESRQRFLRNVIDRANRYGGKTSGGIVIYLAALELASEQYASEGLGLWSAFRLQAIKHSLEWQQSLMTAVPTSVSEEADGAAPVAANRSPFERTDNSAPSSDAVFRQRYETNVSPMPVSAPETQELRPIRSVSTFQEIDQELVLPEVSPATANLPGDSLWLNHPAVLFWRASDGVDRLELWDQEAFRKLGLSHSAGVWRSFADQKAMETMVARAISLRGPVERPVLDGVLDEKCWERISEENGSVSESPSQQVSPNQNKIDLRVAYDSDFVYFAIQGIFDAQDFEDRAKSRKRDEDLRGNPRVCLEVDVDRDLQTRYRLSVDRQGRTKDSCDGFLQWQPRWYVATRFDGDVRTVEIAVHREDFVKLPVVSGDRWRVRATMLAPSEPDPIVTDLSPQGWVEVRME